MSDPDPQSELTEAVQEAVLAERARCAEVARTYQREEEPCPGAL